MKSLFDKNVSRLDVLSAKCTKETKTINITVHRNHSFEMISNVINPFLNYFGINAVFEYSSYDDSLTFPSDMSADLHILWLDLDRYNKDNVRNFLDEKLSELSSLTTSPIVLGCIGQESFEYNNSKAFVVNVNDIIECLKENAFDLAKEKFSGTRLSAKASIKIAQYLGLKIIPSFFIPKIKAIVTDLDNTFYKGILGEDGAKNLTLHKDYQTKLNDLAKNGYMICIASKNDEDEVKDLFAARQDFVLNYDDFTCKRVNWDSKAKNIAEMAKEMNIGLDSVLFVDDNIAEIETVKTAVPEINTILFENEDLTVQTLNLFAGFLKTSTREDALRSEDIKANQKRTELAKTLSKEEYFKKLGIKIDLSLNNSQHAERITELLNKTNQFILSYKRYNRAQVDELLNGKDACIVTAGMSDKLSDSGIIAILICKKENQNLVVDELTFSCRALGRNIEDIVISKMLKISANYLKTEDNVIFNYQKGQRNFPALKWLSAYTGSELLDFGSIKYVLADKIETYGLEVKELCNVN